MVLSLCLRNARPRKALAHPLVRLSVPEGGRVRRTRAAEPRSSSLLGMSKKEDLREVL